MTHSIEQVAVQLLLHIRAVEESTGQSSSFWSLTNIDEKHTRGTNDWVEKESETIRGSVGL